MNNPISPRGAIAGLCAMLGALVTLQLMSSLTNAPALIEALADGALRVMPFSWFDWLKTTLGEQAKTWLYAGIVVGFLVAGVLCGWMVQRAARGTVAQRIATSSGILFAIAIGLQYSINGDDLVADFLPIVLTLAVSAVTFGALLWGQLQPTVGPATQHQSRRRAIGMLAGGLGLLVLGRNIVALRQRQADSSPEQAEADITPAITPNDAFYTISKNFVDPANDRGPDWHIDAKGLVDEERAWSATELAALGEDHTITTMLCISNNVGGNLIGTAEWTGVPMATFLRAIGASGDYVRFHGADGYNTTVPMERCTQPQAWIVWGMNGEALPEKHGAPVRAIIPGLYGMKSVKWLTTIEPTNDNVLGYWESSGWTNEAVVKPMSRIDYPRRVSDLVEGSVSVRGVAFGGDHAVDHIELSTDGGDSWHTATITEQPNPEGIAWSLWQYDWLATAGKHTLVVRMVTTDGAVQTSDEADPLPDGASGWHTVDVRVQPGR